MYFVCFLYAVYFFPLFFYVSDARARVTSSELWRRFFSLSFVLDGPMTNNQELGQLLHSVGEMHQPRAAAADIFPPWTVAE